MLDIGFTAPELRFMQFIETVAPHVVSSMIMVSTLCLYRAFICVCFIRVCNSSTHHHVVCMKVVHRLNVRIVTYTSTTTTTAIPRIMCIYLNNNNKGRTQT